VVNPGQPQPKPFNALKWLAIGCGGLFLLGALVIAALVGGAVFFANKVVDPKESLKTAKSMADYTIPGGEVGLKNFNIGPIKVAQVGSSTKPPDLVLTVVAVDGVAASPSSSSPDAPSQPPRSKQVDMNSWQDLSEKEMEGILDTADRKTENKQLCGQPVAVAVQTGKMTVAGKELPAVSYEASARFKESERIVLLIANGERAQENVESVFNSIQCK